MAMRLKDKVVLITGGGTGIGKAIAILFAQEGARVTVTGRRSEPLAEVVETISHAGGEALAVPGDVTVTADVQRVVQSALDRFGRIDILINNAGNFFHVGPLHELSDEIWDKTHDIFLKGTFRYLRAVIPQMLQQGGGAIVNIGSVGGLKVIPGVPIHAYATAKAGVVMLTKTVAVEYAKQNIRCNCVCPAGVETPDSIAVVKATTDATHPMGRKGKPEEIAQAVLYLASNEASWTTGAILMVDGGVMAQ